MNGGLSAWSICCIQNVKNPIEVENNLMKKKQHYK